MAPWNTSFNMFSADVKFVRKGTPFAASIALAAVGFTTGTKILTCTATAGVKPGAQIASTGIGASDVNVVESVDSGTQLTLVSNTTSTEAAAAATVHNVSGYDVAPAFEDASLYSFGWAPQLNVKAEGTKVDIERPDRGLYVYAGSKIMPSGATITGTLQQLSDLALEDMRRLPGVVVEGTSQEGFTKVDPIEGWIQVQCWNQDRNKSIQDLYYCTLWFNGGAQEYAKGKYQISVIAQVMLNGLGKTNIIALANDPAFAA